MPAQEKRELMTSENSEMSSYQIFDYGTNGLLTKIETYGFRNNDFILTSMKSFEYEGEFIVRKNLHNEPGAITQFRTYEYDNNGNVAHEKYYSHLFTNSTEPRLINEHSFKYDNKKKPFVIFKALGSPGLYSNTSNVIEVNSVLHDNTSGIPKHSTSKTSYKYNLHEYPTTVLRQNDEYEYTY